MLKYKYMFGRKNNANKAPKVEQAPADNGRNDAIMLPGVHIDRAPDPEQKHMEQLVAHENKIVLAIANGDPRIYAEKSIVRPSAELYDSVLKDIEAGKVDESALLSPIMRPVDRGNGEGVNDVFNTNISRPHFAQFLDHFTDNKEGDVYVGVLMSFCDKYPTPAEFEGPKKEYLNKLLLGKTPQEGMKIVEDLKFFENAIYGKQAEYHEAFTALQAQANFKFGKQERRERKETDTQYVWDMLPQGYESEISSRDIKHQEKLISYFLSGDTSSITREAKKNSQADRREVLERIANGQIDHDSERYIISRIANPVDQDGIANVYNKLNTDAQSNKHFRRILAYSTGKRFDDVDNISSRSLNTFMSLYNTPLDFEKTKNELLDAVSKTNSEAKYQQYVEDMEKFEHTVYGIQYEYAKALKQLHAESRELFSTKNFDAQKTPEIDETTEVLISDGGYYQMTRAQARGRVEVAFGEVLDVSESEDTVLYKPSKGLFGVFDGVGGSDMGHGASRRAADVFNQLSEQYEFENGANLAWALDQANQSILNDPELSGHGQTTGVVAKIVDHKDGRKTLPYATVGDSRLYKIDKQNNVELITQDEGEGRYVTNVIGDPRCKVKQFGDIDINPGDRFMLCSDGITGDKPEEMMSGAQIGAIMRASKSDFEAAHNLMMTAKKFDDRTAIVFTPKYDGY